MASNSSAPVSSTQSSVASSQPASSVHSTPSSPPVSPPPNSPSAPLSSSQPVSSPSPTSSAPSSSTTILTTPSTSLSRFTSVATSNGQVYTTVVQITATLPAGATIVASTHDAHSPSHSTGAIVGGVLGGLAVLGLAVGGLLWYRRRAQKQDAIDFDPARVGRPTSVGPEMLQAHSVGGTLPILDLDDEDDGMGGRLAPSAVGGGIITPFAYAPTVSAFDTSSSSRSQSPPMPTGSPPPMSQYSQEGYAPTMSSVGGYYAANPQQPHAPGGYYPTAPSSTSGSSAYAPRSAKEREATSSRAFAVANPSANEPGTSEDQIQAYLRSGPRHASQNPYSMGPGLLSPTAASTSGASGVIVHQDGGRVEPEIEEADEIPPTYDSIPNEGQRK
uniref:Uncharacterized protein n=1 Tax=Mycena chlorophos TaxID=658473 RepID=A0ABQ0LBE6_MYCCL|nr:predicted protein [Mycena chlorophos]